jgi:NTF2 fold immunity protein
MDQMRRCICSLMIATVSFLSASLAQNDPEIFERKGDLVSDKKTAIRIAEAILFPIYGEKDIRAQQPYQVRLKDGKWIMDGAPPPRGFAGGSFHIVILQHDARVLEIYHDA